MNSTAFDTNDDEITTIAEQIPTESGQRGFIECNSFKYVETYEPSLSPTKSILTKSSLRSISSDPASSQNGFDTSELILLTSDQCENLPFPLGTSIWWEAENGLNEGRIKAVYFNTKSRDLRYAVTSEEHVTSILMSAKHLAYAPLTPVYVSPPHSSESVPDLHDKGVNLLKGSVLLSRKIDVGNMRDENWIYTVVIENECGMRIIDSFNVVYRH